jgi:hypothetical protein
MAAAIPFTPMIIGAGAGAMLDKKNPMRGALLGAAGGSALGPAFTAMSGIGTAGMGTAASMAANPAAMMGAEAAGAGTIGLPSMQSLAATMPGGMAAPGAMGANGASFGANALTAANAYNAVPAMDRLSALFQKPTMASLKNPALNASRGLFQMAGQQQTPPMAALPPPPQQAMPPRPINPMLSGRIIRPQQRKY